MGDDFMKSLEAASAPPREFWENDLEMAHDHLFSLCRQDGHLGKWIRKCTGRQIDILCKNLGILEQDSVRQKKDCLYVARHEMLFPYVLVDEFSRFKSKVAVQTFAQSVLDQDTLALCQTEGCGLSASGTQLSRETLSATGT